MTRILPIFFLSWLCSFASLQAQEPLVTITCPKADELLATSRSVYDELNQILRFSPIIPEYNWTITYLFPLLDDQSGHYFQIVKNNCGEQIAKRSWVVGISSKRVARESPPEGVYFVAKHKEMGWLIWGRYK